MGLELANPEVTHSFCRAAIERGLILNWILHADTIVRVAPPLVISDSESEQALRTIEILLENAVE